MGAKPDHVISHGAAVIMVREAFNITDYEQIKTIIGASCRGAWRKNLTRQEFAARLASVRALFSPRNDYRGLTLRLKGRAVDADITSDRR